MNPFTTYSLELLLFPSVFKINVIDIFAPLRLWLSNTTNRRIISHLSYLTLGHNFIIILFIFNSFALYTNWLLLRFEFYEAKSCRKLLWRAMWMLKERLKKFLFYIWSHLICFCRVSLLIYFTFISLGMRWYTILEAIISSI